MYHIEKPLRIKRRAGKEQKEVSVTPARVRTIPLIEARDADRTSCMSKVLEIASVHESALT